MSESQPEQRDLLALGRAVSQVREEQGLSSRELAATTGIMQSRIQALEAGRMDPDYELLLALAEGLGVWPSAFIVRAEELSADDQTSGEAASPD